MSADEIKAAMRAAEDEGDVAAAAAAEREVAAEMDEFTKVPAGACRVCLLGFCYILFESHLLIKRRFSHGVYSPRQHGQSARTARLLVKGPCPAATSSAPILVAGAGSRAVGGRRGRR